MTLPVDLNLHCYHSRLGRRHLDLPGDRGFWLGAGAGLDRAVARYPALARRGLSRLSWRETVSRRPHRISGTARRRPERGVLARRLGGGAEPQNLLFYVAVFPQFITPSLPIALQLEVLSASFLIIALAIDSLYAVLAERLSQLFSNQRWARLQHPLLGTVLMATSAGLAASQRSRPQAGAGASRRASVTRLRSSTIQVGSRAAIAGRSAGSLTRAMVFMPAAKPPLTPGGLSSITKQRAGRAPMVSAVWRNRSGAGFGRATMSAEKIRPSKHRHRSVMPKVTRILSSGPLEATQVGTPSVAKASIKPTTPATGFNSARKATYMAS